MNDLFRVYTDVGTDGYPREWHHGHCNDALGIARPAIKDLVREQADHRCVRCLHPYDNRNRQHGNGEWSCCDERCTHGGPARMRHGDLGRWQEIPVDSTTFNAGRQVAYDLSTGPCVDPASGTVLGPLLLQAQWRILTVHHLNGDKADCRWWNLAALCQRDHLYIQSKVVMAQAFPFEHSEWFKPFAAGFYASVYLGEELTREQVGPRIDELLALERVV